MVGRLPFMFMLLADASPSIATVSGVSYTLVIQLQLNVK